MKRPYRLAGYVGLGMLGAALALTFVFPAKAPQLPRGFFTPVVAFEFVASPAELRALFGPPGSALRAEMLRRMNLGNLLDYGFMALYALFLGLFCALRARETGFRFLYLGCGLAVAALVGDFLENWQLFYLSKHISSAGLDNHIALLQVFTWIKWTALCLTFLVLSPGLFSEGLLGRVTACLSVFTFAAGLAALASRGLANEVFAMGVFLLFVLLVVQSFTLRAKAFSA